MNASVSDRVNSRNQEYNYGIMTARKPKIIIRFGARTLVLDLGLGKNGDTESKTCFKQYINEFIHQKWGLHETNYYLDLDIPDTTRTAKQVHRDLFVEIRPRIRGGSGIKAIFKAILGGIFSIFKPIVKPLAAIANAFLMLIKGVIYIIMLLMWFLKFCVWFFTEVLPSIPTDIFGMVRFISAILIDSVVGTIAYYFRKIFNSAGSTVIGAALTGWDNNPDADDAPRTKSPTKSQTESEFADSKEQTDVKQPSCEGRKCYMTEAGTVPWTVILATVLFPPAGVFMELGLHGWIQILVCLLLTFMFYFPGLIYALILLYC